MRLTDHTAPEAAPAQALGSGALAGIHEISCDNGALRLQLSRSSLYRLDLLVREGFRTAPAGGSTEIGGILIGTLAPDHSIVRLLDVVPIQSEYRFGPAFRPSEDDLQSMARVIAEHSNGPRCVIGYFRSHLQDNVSSLRLEDERLLQRFFADRGCSVILVQPDLDGQTNALFCQWDGGDRVRLLERIPLVTKQIQWQSISYHRVPVPELHPARPPDPVDFPSSREIQNVPHPAPSPVLSRYLPLTLRQLSIAAVALIALIAVFALGRFSRPRKTAVIPAMLDLAVEVHNKSVEVKWNPGSSAIGDSERGVLQFVDGSELKRIDLNQAQLRTGHYAYAPRQRDLTCLMTVYRKHDVFVGETKSVRLNFTQTATASAPPLQTVVPPNPPVDNPVLKPSLAHSPVPAEGNKPAADKKLPANKAPAPGKKLLQTRKPVPSRKPPAQKAPVPSQQTRFIPPPVRADVAPVPRLDDPPKIGNGESGPEVSSLPLAAPVAIATAAAPPFSVPTPIARVVPVLPPAEKHAIFSDLSIRVAVKVDHKGRVTGAHSVNAASTLEKLLAPYAEQAARRWRFDPARRNGVPVAGDTTVTFQFTRER